LFEPLVEEAVGSYTERTPLGLDREHLLFWPYQDVIHICPVEEEVVEHPPLARLELAHGLRGPGFGLGTHAAADDTIHGERVQGHGGGHG
jgi:hypothetical protein